MKSDYRKYFGNTFTDVDTKLIEVEYGNKNAIFEEENNLARLYMLNRSNYKKHGILYEVECKDDKYQLRNKNKLYPLYEKVNCELKVIEHSTTEPSVKTKQVNEIKFEFKRQTADCELIIKSIKRIIDLNSWLSPNEEFVNETLKFEQLTFLKITTTAASNISGLRNCFIQFMENHYIGINHLYEVLLGNDEIILFPVLNDSQSFIDSVEPLLDDFVEYLKDYIYDQFYYCICEDGCFNCLYDTRNENRGKNKSYPSKNELFRIIAGLRNEKGIEEVIKVRSSNEKIDDNAFIEILNDGQKKILKIFQDRFNFEINELYPVRRANLEENLLGLCDHNKKTVFIKNDMTPLNFIIEVIAHEITHNWQIENMTKLLGGGDIPFDGKLFIEGFAQWMEFRVMDFLGLHNNMEKITLLSIDSKNPNEYGLGFRICRFIEENYGFGSLIEFIKTEEFYSNGNMITYDNVIKEFGLQNYINIK